MIRRRLQKKTIVQIQHGMNPQAHWGKTQHNLPRFNFFTSQFFFSYLNAKSW
jgi:hypothetical protein